LEKNYKYIMYNLKEHNYIINTNEIQNLNEPDDLCYVLFTSGTTGKPKGVLINNLNLNNFVKKFNSLKNNKNNLSAYNIFKNNNINCVLGISNFSFDATNIEVLFSLVHGLKIVLTSDLFTNDLNLLTKYIVRNEVELIQFSEISGRLIDCYIQRLELSEILKRLVFEINGIFKCNKLKVDFGEMFICKEGVVDEKIKITQLKNVSRSIPRYLIRKSISSKNTEMYGFITKILFENT